MLSCLLAAPLAIPHGRRYFLVRPMTIGGFAFLLKNGAVALGVDLDAGDTLEWADDKFRAWMFADGAPLVLWDALKRDHPSLDIEAAAELLEEPGGVQLFERAFKALMSRSRFSAPAQGKGTDVAAAEWGKTLAWLAKNVGALPEAVADMTLDQLDMLLTNGGCDDAVHEANRTAAQEQWLEAARERASEQALELLKQGKRADAEVTLAQLGLAFTPESLAEYEAEQAKAMTNGAPTDEQQ